MNNKRRKMLDEISGLLSEAYAKLEEVTEEETECFDNIPENLQNSERYDRAADVVELLESAYSDLEDVINAIDEARE